MMVILRDEYDFWGRLTRIPDSNIICKGRVQIHDRVESLRCNLEITSNQETSDPSKTARVGLSIACGRDYGCPDLNVDFPNSIKLEDLPRVALDAKLILDILSCKELTTPEDTILSILGATQAKLIISPIDETSLLFRLEIGRFMTETQIPWEKRKNTFVPIT